MKNSIKTLVKIEGKSSYKFEIPLQLCLIDVQMIGAALASFEFIKMTCLCVVCGLPFDATLKLLDSKAK